MKKKAQNKQPYIDPQIFAGIKAPILILDSLWQEQFRGRKTEKIIALETKIKDLMKENARAAETEKQLINKKKECLKQIRQLTPAVHERKDQEAVKATEIFKNAVCDINSELDSLNKNTEKLPKELEDTNRELLAETVSIIYFSMRDSQERLKTLGPEIERLRGEVQRLTKEQISCEEETARAYQLLHKLAGREAVNILDRQFKA